jgi:hypothetical protein
MMLVNNPANVRRLSTGPSSPDRSLCLFDTLFWLAQSGHWRPAKKGSPQLRQRIFSADVATLEAWVERVSDASDLQSVFESN